MAERKIITTISVITDCETSYDNIGDIDGGAMDKEWLKQHIESHGADGLYRVAAWINFQTFEAARELSQAKEISAISAKL
jgi:hypothetical protein